MTTTIRMTGRGARGESFADVARRQGSIYGAPVSPSATDADVIGALVQAVVAPALAGMDLPVYTTLAAAHAATATDDAFLLASAYGGFQRRVRTASGSDVVLTFAPPPLGYYTETVNGQPVSVPYSQPVTDLFVFVGQSNFTENYGDAGLAPSTDQYEIDATGAISSLDGSIGVFPGFANAHFAKTGRTSAYVKAAVAGSSLLAAANGASNWSPTGAHREAAVTLARTAIDALSESPELILGNVYFVMALGETEANAIASATPDVSGALWTPAVIDLAEYFKAQIPAMQQLLVVRVGIDMARNNGAAWAEMREAQEDAAAASSLIRIIYRGATSFGTDALGFNTGTVHWDQEGHNVLGPAAGYEAGNRSPSAIPTAPAILASEAFLDTSTATSGTTRTDSHTTAADTLAIIIGVAAVKTAISSTSITSSVTFGGVAATRLPNFKAGGTNATETSAVGRVDISWWLLTESDYGSSLDGATADIVVTQPSAVTILSTKVYDLDCEPIVESTPHAARLPGSAGTLYTSGFATDFDAGLTTGAPVLALGMAATVGDGAAALTHTWVGLTEEHDAGGSTGTRAGQATFASATFANERLHEQITVTSSGTTGGGLLIAALRRRVEGEEGV